MVVTRSKFYEIIAELSKPGKRSLDCEATGLNVYTGAKLFSIIIGDETETYYFNFHPYDGEDWINGFIDHPILPREWLSAFQDALSIPESTWYLHNATYDLGLLANEGLEILGDVHCTQAIARVERNDHLKYSLDECAKRIGLEKSDAVEEYISKHGLWDWIQIPGKKTRKKDKYFYKVPAEVMIPYGERDGSITRILGLHQEKRILEEFAAEIPENVPHPRVSFEIEKRFTKTVFRMQRLGIKIDRNYCKAAEQYEMGRYEKAAQEFEVMSGIPFQDSPKVLERAFSSVGESFPLTEKGNPSFKDEVLKGMESPLAKIVQEYRDAAKKCNTYYRNFLYFADKEDLIHAEFNQGGTKPGRCSCANPNLQNLNKEDEEGDLEQPFVVRRAFIPRPGFFFLMKDYKQMEYYLMLDYAGEMGLIRRILEENLDVHDATAQLLKISRKFAKAINFGLLYGEGDELLAHNLGLKKYEARELRFLYFSKLPKVEKFISKVSAKARGRGYVFNYAGRRCYCSDRNFAYKIPNHVIQGGCGYIVKEVQNGLDDFLKPYRTRMVMQLHDDIMFEMPLEEMHLEKEITRIMETTYKPRFLPLATSTEHSFKSWADKVKGMPSG